ncbi:MAG: DUF3486 family protein [Rhodospirillales bacterium]|nr:DUF3486 family protein [Rhodospirillales bacterium]
MPQKSEFDRHFSPAEQAKLAVWLDEHPHVSVDDFRETLAARGLAVGRSTAGREKKRIEDLGHRMRRSRQAMDALAEGLEDRDDSQRSRALIEMARTILFQFQDAVLAREEGEVSAKELADFSRSLKDIMSAARLNQDFTDHERRKATTEAAERGAQEMARHGLSADTASAIRAAIEGAG